jgi:2-polyprenyl-3-methyl-5-hydroxy-6-metoxy-1,4-benzoquinol methylase
MDLKVAFVDYESGKPTAFCRFNKPEDTKKVLEAIELLKPKLGENLELTLLEGITYNPLQPLAHMNCIAHANTKLEFD